MAPVAIGVLWSFIYAGNFGLLNGLLNDLGLGFFATAWLGDGSRAQFRRADRMSGTRRRSLR